MLVLAVFLLVARRRFFACSVSLRSTLLVLPHASLLFCPFQFIRFLLHAALLLFVLVVAFLFRVLFCFGRFRFYISFTGLWVFFPFGSFIFVFSVSLSQYFYAFARLVCFVSLVSFAIVSFAFAFSARFVQSLAFSFLASVTFRGVRYSSVLLVWPFVDRGLWVFSCSCLVFVALSRALFSPSFS